MPVGYEKVYTAVCSFLDQLKLDYAVKEEEHCDHLYIKSGALKANVSVYNSGKIVVGGQDSKLKQILEDAKDNLMEGNLDPANILPFEIEKFPETIKERIPECDDVIVQFINEAIGAYKSSLLFATAFLVGAASEKAISILIDSYAVSIGDEKNRERFKSRLGKKKVISAKYEEFMASYNGCKTKCTDPEIANNLETILDTMFHFYRITRNEVGFPHADPHLDKGVLLANLGQFVSYLERVYGLNRYFQNNEIVV